MSQFICTCVVWGMEGHSAAQFMHFQVHSGWRLWIQSFLAAGGECSTVIKILEPLKISPVISQMLGGPRTNLVWTALPISAAWGFFVHNKHTPWPYNVSNHICGLSSAALLLAVCTQWADYSLINSVNWYQKLMQTELPFLYTSVHTKMPVFCLHFPELLNK